ncbi:MAG: hypothetical protein HY735_16340 [Verrucomicrobia bacterium]|nr:hypothetical protein [Verrucomicrobiota bacterium]
MSSASSKFAFFRQSGWMVTAVTTSGLFMYAVHIPSVAMMPPNEYAVFATLLQVLNLVLIPGVSLQTVFTQQTAATQTEAERRSLTGAVRALFKWMFILWLVVAGSGFLAQRWVTETLRIANPAALWITLLACLPALWMPIVQGLLQGGQNFVWLGWTAILSGFGRFVTVLVTVVALQGYAAAGMVGPLLGMLAALLVGLWQTPQIWGGQSQTFEWRPWLSRVVPLTLGLATGQIMFAADMIIVQSIFPSDTGMYAATGAIARGIVVFAGPVAMVMFPKTVQSTTAREQTRLLWHALLATTALAGAAALGCTLFSELPYRIMKPAYLPIAPLLPWFAWCMIPLTLAVVLINYLLARSRFEAVPWLLLVALTYPAGLGWVAGTFQTGDTLRDFLTIVQTLGGFNVVLLVTAAWFTWRTHRVVP